MIAYRGWLGVSDAYNSLGVDWVISNFDFFFLFGWVHLNENLSRNSLLNSLHNDRCVHLNLCLRTDSLNCLPSYTYRVWVRANSCRNKDGFISRNDSTRLVSPLFVFSFVLFFFYFEDNVVSCPVFHLGKYYRQFQKMLILLFCRIVVSQVLNNGIAVHNGGWAGLWRSWFSHVSRLESQTGHIEDPHGRCTSSM